MIRKLSVALICGCVLFAQTGCSSMFENMASESASDTVESFVDDFLDSPDDFDYKEYFEKNPKFKVTDEQLDVLTFAIKKVKYEVISSTVDNDREKAKVVLKFTHVYDIDSLEQTSGTTDSLIFDIGELDKVSKKVTFKLVRDDDENWVISDMDDFDELLMSPYEELDVYSGVEPSETSSTEPSSSSNPSGGNNPGSGSATDYNSVCQAYIYTVWFDVNMDSPLATNSVSSEDAFAVKNVFYFNEPVYCTLKAELSHNGQVLLSNDIVMEGEVTCECDFSAGLNNMTNFEAGDYKVTLYYDGQVVAEPDVMTVN